MFFLKVARRKQLEGKANRYTGWQREKKLYDALVS